MLWLFCFKDGRVVNDPFIMPSHAVQKQVNSELAASYDLDLFIFDIDL